MLLKKQEIYTPKQIADHIGVNRQTVINYIITGLMEGRKIGGRWLITREQFERFWEDSKNNLVEN